MEELTMLLNNVSDSYFDFVDSLYNYYYYYKIVDYLDNNYYNSDKIDSCYYYSDIVDFLYYNKN